MTVLTDKAQEEGTYIITLTYYDEDNNAVTPNTVTWDLTDVNGKVINSRSSVSISSPSTSNDVVLQGDDLRIIRKDRLGRRMTVEYTYDSDAGSDLPGKAEIYFEIEPFTNVR